MNMKKGLVIGGLVAVGGVVLYSIKKKKNLVDYKVEEYIIGDFDDVKAVLENINETVKEYGNVSVADYYDLISITPSYVDNAYGWTAKSIKKIKVGKARGGYVIKFPPVEVL